LSEWRETPIGGGPLSAADRVKIVRPIALTFAPRELLSIEESARLIVADAFGSKLAVINVEDGFVESIRDVPAHGIRQLRIHPAKPRLMFTHQMLNRMAPTTQDDVHWGGVMVNCLRSLPLAEVLNPAADPIKASLLDYLGGPEHGAGDPAGFVIRADGTAAVALSGTNEVAFDDGNRLYSRRVEVGVCPTAITMTADGRRAYVANTLSDSISLLDMNERRLVQTVPLGPTPDLTATDRGERLFHDSRLSHDRWFSCASCHIDGHTSGQLNDNKTDATFGTAKRVLTLLGVADTAPYAWNGRFATLGQQIRHSVLSTMQGEELSDAQVDDLESYLKTLPPPPAAGATDPVATKRGAALFQRLDCSRCHKEPVFTTPRVVDVKLSDERGQSRYNPPSLRGVSQNGPYFHDGRASSLQEVLGHFQHQLPVPLTDDEIQDLIEYLKTL
jgi:YVTN family beta-propeller protein